MAWDTEATRRKLLDAGARQFAARGFAGARMDAIGRDAGVNKERVYQYFGDKAGLYAAVLVDRLGGLLDGADVHGEGPAAVGGFAGELFDRFRADPVPARLLAWESLELGEPAVTDRRAQFCIHRVDAIRSSLPGIGRGDAEHLLLSVVALVASWWTLSHLSGVMLGVDSNGGMDSNGGESGVERRRAVIVRQATDLARAARDGSEVTERMP